MSRSSVFAILALAALFSPATAAGPVARRAGRGRTGLRRGGAAQRATTIPSPCRCASGPRRSGSASPIPAPPPISSTSRAPPSDPMRPKPASRSSICRTAIPPRTSSSISTRTASGASPAIASPRRGGTSSAPSTRASCGSIRRARATSIGARCTSRCTPSAFSPIRTPPLSVLSYVYKAQRSLTPLDKNLFHTLYDPRMTVGLAPCTGLATRLPHPGRAPGIGSRRHRRGLQRPQGSCRRRTSRAPAG